MKDKDLEIKDLGFGIIYTIEKKQDAKWQNKWQKLKEWLNKKADNVRYNPYDCKSLLDDFELWLLNKISDKMQELEGEDE